MLVFRNQECEYYIQDNTFVEEIRTAILGIYILNLRGIIDLGGYINDKFNINHDDFVEVASYLIIERESQRYIETNYLQSELLQEEFSKANLSIVEPSSDWSYAPYYLQAHDDLSYLQDVYTGLYQFLAYTCFSHEHGNEAKISPGMVYDIAFSLRFIKDELETALRDEHIIKKIISLSEFFDTVANAQSGLRISLS